MRQILLSWLLLSIGSFAAAQEVVGVPCNFMDVAIDSSGNVYAAAYEANEVWRIDPAGGNALAKAPVGKGPVAVAVSGDGTIACANNLGHSVTLLHGPELTVFATVECPKGPSRVTAMPDGRFVAACGFSDSVIVIDPRTPSEPVALEGLGAAPSDVAAGGGWIAAATRFPSGVAIVDAGTLRKLRDIALDEPPLQIAVQNAGRLVALTPSRILVLDVETGKTIKERPGAYSRIHCAGNTKILALTPSALIDMLFEAMEQRPS